MSASLLSMFAFVVFNSGRIALALYRLLIALAERSEDLSEIEEHAKRTIKHARATRALEHRFAVAQNQSRGNPQVVELDVLVDKVLVAIRDVLAAYASTGSDDAESAILARSMLEDLFPKGVTAITQSTHAEELLAVEHLLAVIKEKHAEGVKQLGLGKLVQRLSKLAKAYGAAQKQAKSSNEPDFSEVRAARQRGQEMLLEVVSLVVGRFPYATADHVAARQALLGPVFEQQEAIRAYARSRRAVPDIDPDTGETDGTPIVAPVDPTPPPAPTPVVAVDDLQPAID